MLGSGAQINNAIEFQGHPDLWHDHQLHVVGDFSANHRPRRSLEAQPNLIHQEPNPADRLITNGTALLDAIYAVPSNGNLSIQLSGRIALGFTRGFVHPDIGWTKAAIDLWGGRSVTLWSKDGAVLDGEGLNRLFYVSDRAQLLLDRIVLENGVSGNGGCGMVEDTLVARGGTRFINCSAMSTTRLDVYGGGLAVGPSARAILTNVTFEGCQAMAEGTGMASGGGIGVSIGAQVTLADVRIENTSAVATANSAYGGGVSVGPASTVTMERVTLIDTECHAAASAVFVLAWGGGIGVSGTNAGNQVGVGGGLAEVSALRLERTRAIATGGGNALGGGIGTRLSGRAIVRDSRIHRGEAISRGGIAFGGGIAGNPLDLFNVTIAHSSSSSPERGRDLFVREEFTAAMLTLRGGCSPGDSSTRLIGRHDPGTLLIRDLSLDAPGCPMPPLAAFNPGHVTVAQCDIDMCAPNTQCTMSNETSLSTPLCACIPPDLSFAFRTPVPSPDAYSPELAPYTTGCVGYATVPDQQDWKLNRNWWRAAPNTGDARECVDFWKDGDPTPCAGASGADSYCYPGLQGARCRACVRSGEYYHTSTARCERCPAIGLMARLHDVAILAVIGVGIWVLLWTWRRWRSRLADTPLWLRIRLENAKGIVLQLGLFSKLKLVIGYFQVVSLFPEVFGLSLPPEYFELMRPFNWISFDRLFSFQVPNQCVGDFGDALLIDGLVPFLTIALLVSSCALITITKYALTKGSNAPEARGWCAAALSGALAALPGVILMLFALVPYTSSRIFSTFSCEPFNIQDEPSITREYLYADAAVICGSDAHNRFKRAAYWLIILWPIGVPGFYGFLLCAIRPQTEAAGRLTKGHIAFLCAEYNPGLMQHWELVELARKLMLTGFIFLIPQQHRLSRILTAMVISMAHLVFLLVALPYKQPSTMCMAVATSIMLFFSIIAALLVALYNVLVLEQVDPSSFFGFATVLPLIAIIFSLSVVVVVVAVLLFAYQWSFQRRMHMARRLRHRDGTEVVATELGKGQEYHLFLSHVWGTGQDQMRIIKQRLLEMVASLHIFLDVDDLEEIGNLPRYIDASQTVLVFCSEGYAQSKNCMIELRTAVAYTKPLIALLETEAKHGGITQANMTEELVKAEGCFAGWGFEPKPSGRELSNRLFKDEAIEWNRIGPMQTVTLRLCAERSVVSTDLTGFTYVQDELTRHPQVLLPPPVGLSYHLYCSTYNEGAEALAKEVASARNLTILSYSTTFTELQHCAAMLVYLTARTWTSGKASALFAQEVESAMKQGQQLVLAHEMPGIGQETRQAVKFDRFFDGDQTPSTLKSAGIYSNVAVPLKGGPWRETSMALLAKDIAGNGCKGVAPTLAIGWMGDQARVCIESLLVVCNRHGDDAQGGGTGQSHNGGLELPRRRSSAQALLIQPSRASRSDSMPQSSNSNQDRSVCHPPLLARVSSAGNVQSDERDTTHKETSASSLHGQL